MTTNSYIAHYHSTVVGDKKTTTNNVAAYHRSDVFL